MFSKESPAFRYFLYFLVFFGGFANLATEIIGPRLFASLFGNTTEIWAIIISITLIGISVGYFLGGRVPPGRILTVLPLVLLFNAAWLLLIAWLIWELPAIVPDVGYGMVFLTTFAAFFVPAMLSSTVSPMVVALLSVTQRTVGNVYALGTVGSVVGALAAAFFLIPFVGLTMSLKIFAVILALLALVFLPLRRQAFGLAALALVVIAPQPSFRWESESNLTLLTQVEGYYQTLRVYTDNQTFIRMHLGPTFQSEMDLQTKEPVFGYARDMVDLAGNVRGKRILIIGGAGHSQARLLENRGAEVVEVEIDPRVVQVSDEFFGPIRGQVVVQDGRAYVERAEGPFDLIFVDAFDGSLSVPPQLTTREFFESARDLLAPGGRLLYNFIGMPTGVGAHAFQAFSATMASVFPYTMVSDTSGTRVENILFVASNEIMPEIPFYPAPRDGQILTDELNPMEVFLQQSRTQLMYMR